MVHWHTWCTGMGSGMAGKLEGQVGWTGRHVTLENIVTLNICHTGRYCEAGRLLVWD